MQRELPAPTASGVLSKTPFPHLLVYALERRLTGTFELVEGSNVEATLLVLNGCPAKIRTAAPVHYLGTVMEELGMISPDALQSSLAKMQETSRLQGEILLEVGAIDQTRLEAALRSQVERKVEHVFGLSPEATFAYFDDLDLLETYGGAPTPIDPFPVLWRGVREQPAREHVEITVKRVGNAWLRVAANAQFERFAFAARELAAIELLRQRPAGVADIETAIGPELAQILVYFLMIMRQVDLIDPKAVAPAAPAPPQAPPPAPPQAPPPAPPQASPLAPPQASPPAPSTTGAGPGARPAGGQAFARVQLQRQAAARAPLVVEEQVAQSSSYDRRASSPGMTSPVGASAFSSSSTRTPGAFAPVAAPAPATARGSAADAATAHAPTAQSPIASTALTPTTAQASAANEAPAQASAAQAAATAHAPTAQSAIASTALTPTTAQASAANEAPAQATTAPSTAAHPSATALGTFTPTGTAQTKTKTAQGGPAAKQQADLRPHAPPPVPTRVGAITASAPATEPLDNADGGVNIDSMIAQVIGGASVAAPASSDPSKPIEEALGASEASSNEPEPEQATADAAPPPAASSSQPLSAEHSALRAKILERAAQISSLDYFQVLELDRTASPEAARKAFIALAKVWHPDRLPPALADVRDACTKVFTYLNEAHATLSNATGRQEYLDDGATTAEHKKTFHKILEAATEFQKAEFLLKRNPNDPQAYELVKRCVSLDNERVEYVATLAWLDAQLPDGQSREKTLEKVALLDQCIDKNPNCERAYFYRGMLLKRIDDPSRALKDFKKSAELNPRNLDALREVRLHNMRGGAKPKPSGKRNSKPPQSDKVGGLFGRLFKK